MRIGLMIGAEHEKPLVTPVLLAALGPAMLKPAGERTRSFVASLNTGISA